MRRKVLQSVANDLCHMLIGWRMGDDLEKLASLPDGTLRIDCLTATARHSQTNEINLRLAGELSAWFVSRLAAIEFPLTDIREASVTADIRTDRIQTNRKKLISFDFKVRTAIATSDRAYVGVVNEAHSWHQRIDS